MAIDLPAPISVAEKIRAYFATGTSISFRSKTG